MPLHRYKFLLIIPLFTAAFTVQAQQSKIINYSEVGALLNSYASVDDGSTFNGFRTRTGLSKLLTNNVAVGFALGTDNYKRSNGSTYNLIPISINASLYPNSNLTGFRADVYGGYSVKLFRNHSRGLLAGAGLGYGFLVGPRTILGIQSGYNYQELEFPSDFISRNFQLGTFRLGVGITFK